MLKVSEELLTKSKIADALGTNPMRVTRFIERNKINAVKKEGKRELFKLTDDYILTLKKQLEDQQKQFDEVLKSKEETIDSLKETIATSKHAYEDMKDQLVVKDNQISSLTKLTNNAQTLNLVDKDPKRLQSAQGNAETSNEKPSSEKEKDSSSKEAPKSHWWQRLGKH